MYGLPQAGILSNNQIAHCLHNHRYYQVTCTPVSWQHAWIPISFTVVVGDFVIDYVGREHAYHLMSALKIYYKNITTDWEGTYTVV